MANRVKKTIIEKMDEDPTLFRRFSEMVETAISQYETKRMSDAEFLARMREIVTNVRTRTLNEDMPSSVASRPVAQAYWRSIKATLDREHAPTLGDDFSAAIAVDSETVIESLRKVNWVRDQITINQMELRVGDLIYDRCQDRGIDLTLDMAELVAKSVVNIAREQRA